MANNWKVEFIDDDTDDVRIASFGSREDAMKWIKSLEVQERYDPTGFEVIDGPYDDARPTSNGSLKTKIWVDDIRPAPKGYLWLKSVEDFIEYVIEHGLSNIEVIDLDNDAGDYASKGGDYIRILDYLELKGAKDLNIRIHSANPVGVQKMRRIIQKNGWTEVQDILEENLSPREQIQMLFESADPSIKLNDDKLKSLDHNHLAYGVINDSMKNDGLRLVDVSSVEGKPYFIAEIAGGDNGSNDQQKWLRYLETVQRFIAQMFAHGCKDVWLVDFTNDCPDDVFCLHLAFRLEDEEMLDEAKKKRKSKAKKKASKHNASQARIVDMLKNASKDFQKMASNNDPQQFAKIVVAFDDLAAGVGAYDFDKKEVLKEVDSEDADDEDKKAIDENDKEEEDNGN